MFVMGRIRISLQAEAKVLGEGLHALALLGLAAWCAGPSRPPTCMQRLVTAAAPVRDIPNMSFGSCGLHLAEVPEHPRRIGLQTSEVLEGPDGLKDSHATA